MSSDLQTKFKKGLFSLLGTLMVTACLMAASPVLRPFNKTLIPERGKATTTAANYRLQTVVIDAGHGGKDPGGMGANSKEKHITLSVATLLRDKIEAAYPEIEVIMTRSDDTFIPLFERAAIANRHKADLFISIHANIMPGSKATAGTETFVMGQHVAEYNLKVAKRENAAILLEADYETNYDYDPSSDEGHILMAMYQDAFLEQSILFAELVEQQFADYAGRKSRGVKQAGFVVLKATAMPSVLVETGFMSNPGEEKYLLSDQGQEQLAGAIFEAFRAYRQLTDAADTNAFTTPSGQLSPVVSQTAVQKREITKSVTVPTTAVSNRRARRKKKGNSSKMTSTPPSTFELKGGAAPTTVNLPNPTAPQPVTTATEKKAPPPAVLQKEVTPTRVVPATYSAASNEIKPQTPQHYQETIAAAPQPQNDLIFAVQLVAVKRELAMTEARWQKMTRPLAIVKEGDFLKYQARGIIDAEDAKRTRDQLVAEGFAGAFIVIYRNGQRVAASEASQLLKN